MVGNGDALDVVGKTPWHQAMQASVGEHSLLEIDAFWRPAQHWCDVLIPRRSMYQSGGSIENQLKLTEMRSRKSCKCSVAVTVFGNCL